MQRTCLHRILIVTKYQSFSPGVSYISGWILQRRQFTEFGCSSTPNIEKGALQNRFVGMLRVFSAIISFTTISPAILVVQDRKDETSRKDVNTKPKSRPLSKTEMILKTDLKWLA